MTEEVPMSSSRGDVRGLTSADIYHWEFKRALVGGYDMRQVDQFLTRVADAFDGMVRQLELVRERDQEQREQLAMYREMEDTLRNTLVTSQRFSENIVDAAKREADSLVEEAHLVKARAQFEASKLPAEIAEDVKRLREERARLRSELLAILDTHRNLINNLIPAEERVAEQAPKTEVETPGTAGEELTSESGAADTPRAEVSL